MFTKPSIKTAAINYIYIVLKQIMVFQGLHLKPYNNENTLILPEANTRNIGM